MKKIVENTKFTLEMVHFPSRKPGNWEIIWPGKPGNWGKKLPGNQENFLEFEYEPWL